MPSAERVTTTLRATTGQTRTAVRRWESAARRDDGAEAEEAESGKAAAGGSEEEDTRKRRPLVIFSWRLRSLTKMKGLNFVYQSSLLKVE
jgi:hypothetical protein